MGLILLKPKKHADNYVLYSTEHNDVVASGSRCMLQEALERHELERIRAAWDRNFKMADAYGSDSMRGRFRWDATHVTIGQRGRLLRQQLAKYARLLRRGQCEQAKELVLQPADDL